MSLKDRSLRQKVWEASANRATSGDTDNRPLVQRMIEIRAERAKLLGFDNWAAYSLQPQMAKTPEAALAILTTMVPDVVANTQLEQADIEAKIKAEGGDFAVQPWDWEYYAEKVRKAKFDVDENAVRPYFELNNVLKNGVFYTMNRLYGIEFRERTDLPVYHPDVRVFDVIDDDQHALAPLTIRVCDSLSCQLAGADALKRALEKGTDPAQVRIKSAPCMGRCEVAPVVVVGHRHVGVATRERVQKILDRGVFEPEPIDWPRLASYREGGGYALLEGLRAGNVTLTELSADLERAGLRGLGGAGFPIYKK